MNGVSAYAQNQHESSDAQVVDYLPLVKKIGLHLVARLPPDIELDDLMQVGMIGLMQAQDSYDPSQGASFSTYAGIRIKGAMLDELRRNDWAPRSVLQKMRSVTAAIREVENRIAKTATDSDIAAELGVTISEYHKISAELVYCKLDKLEDPDANDSKTELDPFSHLEGVEFRESLTEAISSLPEREKIMMSLYYGDELNLKEIGEVLDVSESRVSQIHGQALARIRTRLTGWLES